LRDAAQADEHLSLTEEEIQAITPSRAFQVLLQHAVRTRNIPLWKEVARDWAPYMHAKANDTFGLTLEDLKRVADFARSEATQRGMGITPHERATGGALPN
jgi:hypothetical protein